MEFDEEDMELDEEEGLYCDYDVGEFCEEPDTKANGLCTTECKTYLKACQEDRRQITENGGSGDA